MRKYLRVRHKDDHNTFGIIYWISKSKMKVPWLDDFKDRTIVVIWDKSPQYHSKKERYWDHQLECLSISKIN